MSPTDVAAEVELLRSMVGRYFPIYDVKVSYDTLALYVSPDVKTLDSNFESLRRELKAKGFIPFINHTGGEYIISIIRMPEIRRSNIWINRVLLVATFCTTALAGMVLWADYNGASQLFTLDNFLFGSLFFALPLMAILGVHELSHYLMSKRHGVEASLPFFIPSIPPFGTFGAFISMRDPMPSRKALVDIGIAGPIGGLLVTIPVALMGLYLTAHGHAVPGPVGDAGAMGIVIQPLYQLFMLLIPLPANMALHPMAFAAWVGFLVTAINLLPVGQLDGGHIARGLFGENARWVSYATGGLLFIFALFFEGWLLFALLVILMGLRHPAPLNDISKLPWRTKGMGVLAVALLLVTFVPQPMVMISPDHSFQVNVVGGNNTTAMAGDFVYFNLTVNNTGNANIRMNIVLSDIPNEWSGVVFLANGSDGAATNNLAFDLGWENSTVVTVRLHVPPTASGESNLKLDIWSQDNAHTYRTLTVNVA